MITIIVLYILLGIIAFIVILLHFSVRVRLEAASGEKPVIEVKWLFIKIYPRKPKDKSKSKRKRKEPDEKASSKSEYTEEEIAELIRQADEEELSEELAPAEEAKTEEPQSQVHSIESIAEAEEDTARKAKKEKKKKEKKAKAEKAEADIDSESEKSEGGIAKLKRYADMILPYVPMAWKAFKKILKTIRFTHLDIELVSGKEDAYDAAMAYGKLNAGVYNGVATLGRIFTVRAENIKVYCRFNEKAFEYDVSTTVMVRPSTLIAIVFCVGVNFLRIFIPQKLRAWRERMRENKRNKKMKKYNETELLTNE